jgi:hypothetical protein
MKGFELKAYEGQVVQNQQPSSLGHRHPNSKLLIYIKENISF